MADKKSKAKFKVGQKVWYIADGYIAVGFVQGLFLNKHGNIMVSLNTLECNYKNDPAFYYVNDDGVKHQDDVYPTKEALVSYVKKVEDDTLED